MHYESFRTTEKVRVVANGVSERQEASSPVGYGTVVGLMFDDGDERIVSSERPQRKACVVS